MLRTRVQHSWLHFRFTWGVFEIEWFPSSLTRDCDVRASRWGLRYWCSFKYHTPFSSQNLYVNVNSFLYWIILARIQYCEIFLQDETFNLGILIFFKNLNLYWTLLYLQCCVSFRCTAKWFSYTYIYSFFKFFSYLGYCRIVSKVPCAIL